VRIGSLHRTTASRKEPHSRDVRDRRPLLSPAKCHDAGPETLAPSPESHDLPAVNLLPPITMIFGDAASCIPFAAIEITKRPAALGRTSDAADGGGGRRPGGRVARPHAAPASRAVARLGDRSDLRARRGTEISNPAPSSGESANFQFLSSLRGGVTRRIAASGQ
jgi:hypothetical protein